MIIDSIRFDLIGDSGVAGKQRKEIAETEAERGTMMIKGEAEAEYSGDEQSPRGVFEIQILGTDSDKSDSSSGGGDGDGDEDGDGGALSVLEKHVVPGALLQEAIGIPWKAMIGCIKKKPVWKLSTIPLLTASYDISRKNFRKKLARIRSADDAITCDDIPFCKPSWRNYGFSELAAATNNFSPGTNTFMNQF